MQPERVNGATLAEDVLCRFVGWLGIIPVTQMTRFGTISKPRDGLCQLLRIH